MNSSIRILFVTYVLLEAIFPSINPSGVNLSQGGLVIDLERTDDIIPFGEDADRIQSFDFLE